MPRWMVKGGKVLNLLLFGVDIQDQILASVIIKHTERLQAPTSSLRSHKKGPSCFV